MSQFGTIQILGLVFALFVLTRLILIILKPKFLINNIVKKVHSGGSITTITSLILAGFVLYFLIQSLSLVQIFATMLFAILLVIAELSQFPDGMEKFSDTLIEKNGNVWKKAWLMIVFWVLLLLWFTLTYFNLY